MYVLRGSDPEEPISCSGYICNFDDLEITGVLLDDIINGNMSPDINQHLLQLRIKSLRDTEELLGGSFAILFGVMILFLGFFSACWHHRSSSIY